MFIRRLGSIAVSCCALVLGAAAPAAALVLPPEGIALNQIHVQFEWPPVGGADEYQLQVVIDDGSPDPFSSAAPVVDTTRDSLAPRQVVTSGLAFAQDYAWRVRDLVASVPQAWGATHRFQTNPIPPLLPAMSISTGPGTPEPGLTMFQIGSRNGSIPRSIAVAVDHSGQLVWFLEDSQGGVSDIRLLANGRVTFIRLGRSNEALLNGQTTWIQSKHPDLTAHHETFPMPNGNALTLVHDFRDVFHNSEFQSWRGTRIVEFDRATGAVIFDWSTHDHYSYLDFDDKTMSTPTVNGGTAYNWTHANAVTYDQATQTIHISVRMLSRITAIDYPSGTIQYNMGFGPPSMPSGDATLGDNLFSWQHAPELQPNGNLLIYDNGNRRDHTNQTAGSGVSKAVEVALTGDPPSAASIVWEHTLPVYTGSIGDADRQPGGTTVIAVGAGGMIIEVDNAGNEVWRLELPSGVPSWMIYRAERIPALIVDVDGDLDGDGIPNLIDLCADVADPAQLDSDGDGLSDPCDTDDDDDWLLDIYETDTRIFVDETDTGSDPLDPDTNGNGIIDGEEVFLGGDPNTTPTPTPTATPTSTPNGTPTASPTPTPEPGMMLQLVTGGIGLAFLNKRRMRKGRRTKPTRTRTVFSASTSRKAPTCPFARNQT